MTGYNHQDWDLDHFLQHYDFPLQPPPLPYDDSFFLDTPGVSPPELITNRSTPDSFVSLPEPVLPDRKMEQSNKRQRHSSEESQSEGALIRARKTRKLRAPRDTAKVREKGACFCCQKKRKECQVGDDADGSCKRCLENPDKVTIIPGLLRPLCWRPNIGSTEVFRRGPTIDFAVSLRGNSEDAGPGKQALWKHFATRRSGGDSSRIVDLSQGWSSNTLKMRLDKYQPMQTDKQYYDWSENGEDKKFSTPAYGISNLGAATSAIEMFLARNSGEYIKSHMRTASELSRKTFQTAQEYKHLPLVDRALKLWVACRFIETPWSITSAETLGMSKDPSLDCPYHDRIPVPPIVDLQIDLIVINEILQPELKKILKMMKTMLESSDPWNNWFEIYLAYFILLQNVELTMAHDAWFVKRHNLKKRYSNKPLIDTITQGATTLLTCFHYAHQGYAPFTDPELERKQQWPEEQKDYLRDTRPLLQAIRGDHVNDPAKELFWTSQLHRPDWRPVVLMC